MIYLKVLKKILVDSQLFVSLSGTLFSVFFMLEQNTFRFQLVALIFITYFNGYLYTKYQNSNFYFKMLGICTVLGGVCLFLLIQLNSLNLALKWLFIVALGLAYNSKFLDAYIRKLPLIKVFYVGLVWALVNGWLINETFEFVHFLISLLFITALVLPFDIRDMKNDKIITFPIAFGISFTKKLGYLLLFMSVVLAQIFLDYTFFLPLLLSSFCAGILIYYSENSRQDWYFSVLVESCSILPLLFLILLK